MSNLFYEHYDIEEMHDLRQSLLRLAASTRMLINVKQLSTSQQPSDSAITVENQRNISDQFVRDLAAAQSLMDKAGLHVKTIYASDILTRSGSVTSTLPHPPSVLADGSISNG